VSRGDHRRRTRRTALLLSAILIPTIAVVLLVVRVVRQENELAERQAAEEQRTALDQLRRELAARLQALRLAEVNRLIGDSGPRVAPNGPIVFVAPIVQDRMVLPWDDGRPAQAPSPEFARAQADGEAREFRQHDAAAAIVAYQRALAVARSPLEQCSARLWLGRNYLKAGLTAEAERSDRAMLEVCSSVADADGAPLALYAAQRLLPREKAGGPATEYVLRRAAGGRWRSPNEVFALQAILRGMAPPAGAEPLRLLASEIHDIEQISALAPNIPDYLGRLQRASRSAPGDLAWLAYGDEPWLLTVVSPQSFAAPVLMAVSSKPLLPEGVTLRASATPAALPLGDGFVDLHVEWPPGRFAAAAVPAGLYGSILVAVIGAALLAAYLLLRDVHREAEMAAMRSQFVASVSHELKTPLTSIRAHAETMLLGRAGNTETAAEYLKTIVSESERLTRLVDSVLDFSRIEQGRKSYQLQATHLHEVVRTAAKTMEYPLSQLGFTLTISSDETDPTVLADPEALTQAILNLLGNAMKYSGESRHIDLRVGTRGAEAFVDVVDHGIGIPRDQQSRIFERFHRVRSGDTAGIAGTGLGLALALHVVEAHRGRIAVASAPGHGSTFSVLIPLQAQV
jgi:signal transduction histidine kinase